MNSKQEKQFGRYILLDKIAEGGMGEVFLAKTVGAAGFEKKVVIKKILSHLSQNDIFVKRFIDEGRILVKLTQGNIVPIFDLGMFEGEYYIAMEYIDGKDLREILRLYRIFSNVVPIPIALFILNEICKGLGYAHTKTDATGKHLNIIHRDISPSNILISRDGEVKLLDFGIAKATDKISQSISGTLHGKFPYMSPEQARGEKIDARSDLFSLGTVVYEMITGIRAFEGSTDIQTLERVKAHHPEKPSLLNPKVPPVVDDIVMRLMNKDRKKRFTTAQDVHLEIMPLISSGENRLTAVDITQEFKEYFDKPRRSKQTGNINALIQQGLEEKKAVSDHQLKPLATHTQTVDYEGSNQTPSHDEKSTHVVAGPSTPAPQVIQTPQPSPITPPPDQGFIHFTPSQPQPITGSGIYPSSGTWLNRILIILLLGVIAVLLYFNLKTINQSSSLSQSETSMSQESATHPTRKDTLVSEHDVIAQHNIAHKKDISTDNITPDMHKLASTIPIDKDTTQIQLTSVPDNATVYIDSRKIELNPSGIIEIPSKKAFHLTVKLSDGRKFEKDVLDPEALTHISITLPKRKKFKMITLLSDPSGGVIIIGKSKFTTPKKFKVEENQHIRGRVQLTNYHDASFELTYKKVSPFVVKLRKKAFGKVKVRIKPYEFVTVYVDGNKVKKGGKQTLVYVLPVGHHTLVAKMGKKQQKREFTVKEGQVTSLGEIVME